MMRNLLGVLTALGGLLLVTVAVAIGTPASAATTDCSGPFMTQVTNRPDSGLHGDWAKDTFTRTTTVTCLGEGKYQLVLSDVGTFTTIAGATSPGITAAALGASFTGQFTGGAKITVTSDVPPVAPPSTSDGTISSSEWASLLFPGNNGTLDQWGWVYSTKCEQWANTNLGNTGDVTGKICETQSTSTTTPPSTSSSTSTATSTVTSTGSGSSSKPATTSRVSHLWPTTTTSRKVVTVYHNGDLASTGATGVGTLLAVGSLLVLGGGIVTVLVMLRNRRNDRTDQP
jgi:hypothetical protein